MRYLNKGLVVIGVFLIIGGALYFSFLMELGKEVEYEGPSAKIGTGSYLEAVFIIAIGAVLCFIYSRMRKK
jgi:hypothetical protein